MKIALLTYNTPNSLNGLSTWSEQLYICCGHDFQLFADIESTAWLPRAAPWLLRNAHR